MTFILVLSAIGLVAVLAELVLPGGVLGVLGVLCLVAAVAFTFAQYGPGPGVAYALVLVVFGFATLGWWMKHFHRIPLLRRLILQESSGKLETPPPGKAVPGPGGTGRTLTELMPSGRAVFDGRKIDVVSEGPFVPKGAEIEIVARRGPSIVVRPLPAASGTEPATGTQAQDDEAPM